MSPFRCRRCGSIEKHPTAVCEMTVIFSDDTPVDCRLVGVLEKTSAVGARETGHTAGNLSASGMTAGKDPRFSN